MKISYVFLFLCWILEQGTSRDKHFEANGWIATTAESERLKLYI